MTSVRDLRLLAVEIAQEAGELARRRREEGVALAATKSSLADIVTEADREVEALIRARLVAERPGDGFLGEESGAEPGESGLTWVVDPIDGTVNYASGFPSYCVSIAVVEGEPEPELWTEVAGVVFAPALGELFTAERGGGSWLGEKRLQVSTPGAAGALLGTGFGYDPATHDGDLATVRRVMPVARDLRRIGAAALDLAYVAAGRLDGFFERGLKPWDVAAGSMLVREAGGAIAHPDPADVTRRMTVAGSPALVAELVGRIRGD
ncbi:myo-inositol-1(or 4)-monophosphatase [Microbacterium resistens]|uniref:Inositol-1-monophosphatase n=1 Tax=Microbacterium resistens TaxID=156977 RepID=A0ABU1SEZ1_9MICO|nr:myo-inositol-1(or 4)-monophosphatase [Microbacterium resistens]